MPITSLYFCGREAPAGGRRPPGPPSGRWQALRARICSHPQKCPVCPTAVSYIYLCPCSFDQLRIFRLGSNLARLYPRVTSKKVFFVFRYLDLTSRYRRNRKKGQIFQYLRGCKIQIVVPRRILIRLRKNFA